MPPARQPKLCLTMLLSLATRIRRLTMTRRLCSTTRRRVTSLSEQPRARSHAGCLPELHHNLHGVIAGSEAWSPLNLDAGPPGRVLTVLSSLLIDPQNCFPPELLLHSPLVEKGQ
jgi:hypothetical protein